MTQRELDVAVSPEVVERLDALIAATDAGQVPAIVSAVPMVLAALMRGVVDGVVPCRTAESIDKLIARLQRAVPMMIEHAAEADAEALTPRELAELAAREVYEQTAGRLTLHLVESDDAEAAS